MVNATKAFIFIVWLHSVLFVRLLLSMMYIISCLFALPFTLSYHRSAHFGMLESDMPAVNTYLDHFENLHPELMSNVEEAFEAADENVKKKRKKPSTLAFWPRSKDPNTTKIKEWGCSTAVALLAVLEYAGWPRETIWTFLRDQVEQGSRSWEISETQKQDFAKVLNQMRTNLFDNILRALLDLMFSFDSLIDFGYEPPSLEASGGREVVPLPLDSLDWVFKHGCLLTPNPANVFASRYRLGKMGRSLWGTIDEDDDLEKGLKGRWQVVDRRCVPLSEYVA